MTKATKSDVWMPLYVGDWDSDTAHLDCEQDGAYGRLVRHYWKNGALQDDDAMLARIVRMERTRWKRVRPALAPFFDIKAGRWIHKRVEAELLKAASIIEKRRQAGLQGGRPRKQTVSGSESKPEANGSANAKQMGKQTETPAGVTVDVSTSEVPPASQLPSQEVDSEYQDHSSEGRVVPLASTGR